MMATDLKKFIMCDSFCCFSSFFCMFIPKKCHEILPKNNFKNTTNYTNTLSFSRKQQAAIRTFNQTKTN